MNKKISKLPEILFFLFVLATFLSSYLGFPYSPKASILFLMIGAAGSFILFWRTNESRYRSIFEDLKKFRLAVVNASDMIVITDTNGTIVFANKAMEAITGYKTEEVLGKNPRLWGGLMGKEFYSEMWAVIGEKRLSFQGELTNRRKNGEKYVANLHISPVFDEHEKIVFFVGIERDITKEKEIDMAKSEFVSLASHQLRTPLTGISLSSELLLRSARDKIDERERKYLSEISNSTKRMGDLINDLLKISRIELGTFSVKPRKIDMGIFADQLLEELKVQFKEKKLVLSTNYGQNLLLEYDEDVLRMIFENLITNAIRYTTAGGKISLTINKTPEGILLKVEDTGCGIPLRNKDKIFEKLYRAENAKEICAEGTGLGLYIVKSLAEKTGSKVWFESAEGKGSTFFVLFPQNN